MMSKHSKTPF